MALSTFAIDRARPAARPFKIADGGGLFLLVQPSGSKLWRLRYFYLGKERTLSIGAFPDVGLADARIKREEAKKQLATGADPSVQKKLDRIAAETAARTTFGLVAAEFIERLEANGAAPTTLKKNRWLLEDLSRPIAARPIAEVTPAEILDLLKRVEKSGRRESARRLRGVIGSVYRYAIVTLRATSDPTYALQGALLRPNTKPRAAIIDEAQFGGLLRAIDEFDGWPTIKSALQFAALTFARPGEIRLATRTEINFEKAVWLIPAERMKMRRPHNVPLSRQAIAVLQNIWPLSELGRVDLPVHPIVPSTAFR